VGPLGFSLPLVGRVGEGVCQRLSNPFDNPIGFLQHVVIPKPQHSKAVFVQPRGASIILVNRNRMLSSVNFDRQSRLDAEEIENVWPDWYLSAKSVTVDLVSLQSRPQPHLSNGHFVSQSSCSLSVGT
jgi:hypothetical protein